jgi:hypothetical protein
MDSEIQAGIRRAVSSGEFGKASMIWEAYALQMADAFRGGTCSAEELAQMREIIEWTRSVITCVRAHAQLHLNTQRTRLHATSIYRRPLP